MTYLISLVRSSLGNRAHALASSSLLKSAPPSSPSPSTARPPLVLSVQSNQSSFVALLDHSANMTRTRDTSKLAHDFGLEDLIKGATQVQGNAKRVRGKYAGAMKKIAEMERREKERKAEAQRHETIMRSKEIELETKEAALKKNAEAREAEFEAKTDELEAREAELKANADELEAREAALKKNAEAKEAELEAKADELEAREAELKIPHSILPNNDSGSLPPSNNNFATSHTTPFPTLNNHFDFLKLQECPHCQPTMFNGEVELANQNNGGIVLQAEGGGLNYPQAPMQMDLVGGDEDTTGWAVTLETAWGSHLEDAWPEVDMDSFVDFSPRIEA
jgi:hypothetical protein